MAESGSWARQPGRGILGDSLGARLSRRLALLTLLGLTLVAAVVWCGMAINLHGRRSIVLGEKEHAVRHLFDEATQDRDIQTLVHRLDDYFIGHDELAFAIRSSDGNWFYRSPDFASRDFSTEHHRVVMTLPDPGGGTLRALLSISTRGDTRVLRALGWTLATSALLTAIGVSIAGFMLVRKGLRPVDDLAEQTQRLDAGGFSARLDGSAQALELQPLIAQFNALLERLQRASAQLEGFNADVAHELSTPMTNLITSTELALRRPAESSDLQEVLASNLEEVQRLSAIVQDMLFLSRGDRGANARRVAIPSLAELARDVADYHEAVLLEAGLQIEIHGDATGAIDAPLIKRALSNLLDNAARFASPHTTIEIGIETDAPSRVRLAVTNHGDSIALPHLPRLFDRFYRVDPSRQHGDTHHGLGLAIVAAIARMHGGEAFADSARGKTTIGFAIETACTFAPGVNRPGPLSLQLTPPR